VIEHDRDKKANAETPGPADPASADVTREVGSEGGTPGDVELDVDWGAGTGSEAAETWQPAAKKVEKIVRDETGGGRRSP
jgi:hypothetical protein